MISLTLQCCPLDVGAALELAQLICDLEPVRRPETEFWLVYRKDTPLTAMKDFNAMAAQKFARSGARCARNHDVGWPGGSNMLAASAFMEMSVLRRDGLFRNDAFLLFEPDCVPMRADWLDRLSDEWEMAKRNGKEATGCWHQVAGPETLHMNGNAIFGATYYDRHPNLMVGPATQGWDYFFRDHIISLSQDSAFVCQVYGMGTITEAEWFSIQKHGRRPALFHGVKDNSARIWARKELLEGLTPSTPDNLHATVADLSN